MGYKLYQAELDDKIKSARIWRLKKPIQCKDGFYEAGTWFDSKRMMIVSYDKNTQNCVLGGDPQNRNISINQKDFDEYFERDEQAERLIHERDTIEAEEERNIILKCIRGVSILSLLLICIDLIVWTLCTFINGGVGPDDVILFAAGLAIIEMITMIIYIYVEKPYKEKMKPVQNKLAEMGIYIQEE